MFNILLFVVPVIVTIICVAVGLYIMGNKNFFRENFPLVILVPLIVCGIGSGIGAGIGYSKMFHKEFLNFRVVQIEHQEEWTTHETRTETYTTGSGKNQRTHTRIVHYTQHHGPYYNAQTEDNKTISLRAETYQQWKQVWANETKTGEHKGSSALFGSSITGGIFECRWDRSFEKIFPLTETASYKNKVRASKSSVFKYQMPTKEMLAKYPRPADIHDRNVIFNFGSGIVISGYDQLTLQRVNASLGCAHQVHCLFYLFNAKDNTPSVVNDVLAAWQGTNKNELVTFIGIDPDTKKATWVKVESWQDNTVINGFIYDGFMDKPFTSELAKNTMMDLVPKYWKRKHFKDFNYLRIEVSKGGIITTCICWFIGLLSGLGTLFYLWQQNNNNDSSNISFQRRVNNYRRGF